MLQFQASHMQEKTSTKMMSKIAGSVIIFVVAVICYSVTVFAWFQASISNTGNVISAAEYKITVHIKSDTGEISPEADGYHLTGNIAYTVVLAASGGAEKGYCEVSDGTETLKTSQIPSGQELTFTLAPVADAVYTFTAQWGLADKTDIESGSTIPGTVPGDTGTSDLLDGTEETEPQTTPEDEPFLDGQASQGSAPELAGNEGSNQPENRSEQSAMLEPAVSENT